MKSSRHPRLNLPQWTTHPGFGVAALLGVAVLLIVHGEPQPSSRPSGKSVVVSGSPTEPIGVPATLLLHKGRVEYRLGSTVRRVALPAGARPRSILTNRGLSVVMAAVGNRQRAYAVSKDLKVTDLGPADAAFPAAPGAAAIVLEVALVDPGALDQVAPSLSASASSSGSVNSSRTPPGQAVAKDFGIRRYDASGRMVEALRDLPKGMRAAVDTAVGLVVWKPVNPVFDGSIPLEPLSAAAELVRPNGTVRALGSVHPLAATTSDLLVWDVQHRQFGIMPLRYVTSTATSTASTSPDPSTGSSRSRSASSEAPLPSATPTIVVGTRWYDPTRGFTVTGPASFAPDGSAFAVYAQVGSRRRLVVAQLDRVLTNQIEVLALTAPTATSSPTSTPASGSGPASSDPVPGGVESSRAAAASAASASAASASSASAASASSASAASAAASPPAAFDSAGFPIPAPVRPDWWGKLVVAVGSEGTVVGYQPGHAQAALLDLGLGGIQSIADAP